MDNLELTKLICDGVFHACLFMLRWAACLALLALTLCVCGLPALWWQRFGCAVVLCVAFYVNGRVDQHLLE